MVRAAKVRAPRAPREAPPPTRYGKSRPAGVYFEITGGHKRNERGEKLYRLRYFSPDLSEPIKGSKEWTLAEIEATNPRWLKNRPSPSQIRASRVD